MEKFSSFERVVGNIPETEKEQILRDKGEQFDDQVFKELKEKEREKTPWELRVIDLANSSSNELRRKYEMDDFNIPPTNIHIIKENEWPKDKYDDAVYNSAFQAIAVREQPAKIVFARKIFHDMLHFKSYNALQVTIEKNPKIKDYRVGLTVNTRDGKKRYFTNLNEAVTEELTKKFISRVSDDSFFSQEINQTRNIINKYPMAKTDLNEPLFNEDTFYAEAESKKSWHEALGRLFGKQKIFTERFTYQNERNILKILVDKIFERSPEKFQDKEEVFEVFAKGMMTGNILPVGRLIEKTFGNGTLRRIGELDHDMQTQEKFVNSL